MGFRYRADKDILKLLKDVGYSSYRLQKDGYLGAGTLTKIRRKQMISLNNIGTICRLLDCYPNDIIEYIKDESSE